MECTRTHRTDGKCTETIRTTYIELLVIWSHCLITISPQHSTHQSGSYLMFSPNLQEAIKTAAPVGAAVFVCLRVLLFFQTSAICDALHFIGYIMAGCLTESTLLVLNDWMA